MSSDLPLARLGVLSAPQLWWTDMRSVRIGEWVGPMESTPLLEQLRKKSRNVILWSIVRLTFGPTGTSVRDMAPVRVRGCTGPTPARVSVWLADASRRRNGPRKATLGRPITVRLRGKSCLPGGSDAHRQKRRAVVAKSCEPLSRRMWGRRPGRPDGCRERRALSITVEVRRGALRGHHRQGTAHRSE